MHKKIIIAIILVLLVLSNIKLYEFYSYTSVKNDDNHVDLFLYTQMNYDLFHKKDMDEFTEEDIQIIYTNSHKLVTIMNDIRHQVLYFDDDNMTTSLYLESQHHLSDKLLRQANSANDSLEWLTVHKEIYATVYDFLLMNLIEDQRFNESHEVILLQSASLKNMKTLNEELNQVLLQYYSDKFSVEAAVETFRLRDYLNEIE